MATGSNPKSTLKFPFSIYVSKSSDGSHDETNISSFRFERREVPSWEDMKAMVKAQYDITNDVLLKHIDADHEEITIGSQDEWKLAVKAAEKESNQLFVKVYDIPKRKSDIPFVPQRPPNTQQRKAETPNLQPDSLAAMVRERNRRKKEVLKSHIMNINNKVEHLTQELSDVKLAQQHQDEIMRQSHSSKPSSVSSVTEHEGRSVIHENISCSVCRQSVAGKRYKCINCSQYNLCEACEKSSERPERLHPETHVFMKINMPLDPQIDGWISKTPLLGCNLYDNSSVLRYLRKLHRPRRRHRSSSGSSSSSSSSSSGSSTDSERIRYEIERQRNRRRKHRSSSNSASTHDVKHRRKYRRRRSSSSSSHTSTGSSSTGSSSSQSASIITLDTSSKRRICRHGRHHKMRRRHQGASRRHSEKDGSSSGHKHHRRHRHHRHNGRRHRGVEDRPANSRSSVPDIHPPSTFDGVDEEMLQLVEWADSQQSRRAREMIEQDTITSEPTNGKDGLKDVMMTEQELQNFRARLNKLVSPETQPEEQKEPENSQEYFVQTGCGLGDWVPITDDPSISAQPTEDNQESLNDFTLLDTMSSEQQLEQQAGDIATLEPQKLPATSQQPEEPMNTDVEGVVEDPAPIETVPESPSESSKTETKADDAQAKESENSSEPAVEVVDLTTDSATGVTEEPSEVIDVDAALNENTEASQPEASTPLTEQPTNHTPQQTPTYPAQHYPQYQQYPVSGNVPMYPYPAYPPPIDGQTAANLWSATTNVLRSMQSGWQGFVGGQNTGPMPAPAPEVRAYEYQTDKEMQQLIEMGFCNRELNRRLLDKHNQNVDRVVSELINDSNDPWYNNRH